MARGTCGVARLGFCGVARLGFVGCGSPARLGFCGGRLGFAVALVFAVARLGFAALVFAVAQAEFKKTKVKNKEWPI